jgi:hypothetical protein
MQTEPIQLKGGFTTLDPRLDRLPFFDDRSLNYPAVPKLRTADRRELRSNTHNFRKFPGWLDQRREGACVSFGIGHDLMCYPQEFPMHNELCRSLYFEMQKIDPWAGGAYPGADPFYEGTAVLSGLHIYRDLLNLIDPLGRKWEFRWCFGGDDVMTALMSRGVIIGVNWLEGMFQTDEKGFIRPTGRLGGGHCTYLNKSKLVWRKNVTHYEAKDLERELTFTRGRNSWGRPWGVEGDFYLTLADLDTLLAQDGEAAVLEPVT